MTEAVAVGDVADVFNGKTPSKAEQRPDGHPVLKIKDVDEFGCFRGSFGSFVDADLAAKFAQKRIQIGDTLILNAAHNADYVGSKTFRAESGVQDALATGEWLIVRPRQKKLDAAFLNHWINRDDTRQKMRALVKGIHLYPSDVAQLTIAVPPLEKQRQIARLLDATEDLRKKRRVTIAKLNALAEAIFIEMFGDPTTNVKGWKQYPLHELAAKITDGEHLNPTFSSAGMPIVMAGNVLEDSVDILNAKRVEIPLGKRFRRKCNPERGDVLLVSRGATIGRLCRVQSDDEFCLMGSVILIKLNRDIMLNAYLSAFLKLPVMRAKLFTTSGSSAQQAIYLKDLKGLLCPVPSMALQRQFEVRMDSIERLKAVYRGHLNKLEHLFASLQNSAFIG